MSLQKYEIHCTHKVFSFKKNHTVAYFFKRVMIIYYYNNRIYKYYPQQIKSTARVTKTRAVAI